MNKTLTDQQIEAAKEAGFYWHPIRKRLVVHHSSGAWVAVDEMLAHFATLVAAQQPEPRAEVTDDEGCTPADARMLRAANHALAAESDALRRALRPFANIVSTDRLSWAMVEYCVDGDPEKQTFQRPQMQRAFNRAADLLRENVPSETLTDNDEIDAARAGEGQ